MAADDITSADQMEPLLDLVDCIKVDFRAASAGEQKKIIQKYGLRHTCLAEKLETQSEFEAARKLGYKLFQGYFFARPVVLKSKQIPGYKLNYLRILNAVHRPDLEFAELERLISIVRLHLAQDKPDALVMCALVRAAFCEAVAPLSAVGGRKSELFLMGMFSLLDAITGVPLQDALRQIRLAPDMQATLLGKQPSVFPMGDIYQLVQAYEQGDWDQVVDKAHRLRVEPDEISDAYLRAVTWSDEVFSLLPQLGAVNQPSIGHGSPTPVDVAAK